MNLKTILFLKEFLVVFSLKETLEFRVNEGKDGQTENFKKSRIRSWVIYDYF